MLYRYYGRCSQQYIHTYIHSDGTLYLYKRNVPYQYNTMQWFTCSSTKTTVHNDKHRYPECLEIETHVKLFEWCIHVDSKSRGFARCCDRTFYLLQNRGPGVRLTKTCDVIFQRYRTLYRTIKVRKMHILRCMGSKFCVKFQMCPLKYHTKFWTHTPQKISYELVKILRMMLS